MSKEAIIAELEIKGLDIVMGYRIPTEGKQSICNMKCVGFIDDAYGSTIVVPNDWVSQTGSDFDIDKLYFMRKEFRLNKSNEEWTADTWDSLYKTYPEIKSRLENARTEYEKKENIANLIFSKFNSTENWVRDDNGRPRLHYFWEAAGLTEEYGDKNQFFDSFAKEKGLDLKLGFETYDFNKVPWDKSQSKIGRNNLLLEMMQGRLRDPQSIKQRLIPGGFETAIKAANEIKDLMGISDESRDYSDPMTMDELYAKEEMTDEDGMLACQLEEEYAELGGWEAESDASRLLQGLSQQVDIVGRTAAAAGLELEKRALMRVVFARLERVDELSDDEDGGIAGVVVDVFQPGLGDVRPVRFEKLGLVTGVLKDALHQPEMNRKHIRNQQRVRRFHLFRKLYIIRIHFCICESL